MRVSSLTLLSSVCAEKRTKSPVFSRLGKSFTHTLGALTKGFKGVVTLWGEEKHTVSDHHWMRNTGSKRAKPEEHATRGLRMRQATHISS